MMYSRERTGASPGRESCQRERVSVGHDSICGGKEDRSVFSSFLSSMDTLFFRYDGGCFLELFGMLLLAAFGSLIGSTSGAQKVDAVLQTAGLDGRQTFPLWDCSPACSFVFLLLLFLLIAQKK